MPAPPPLPLDWQQALALLDEALSLSSPQRELWLAKRVAGQPGVLALLLKLLQAHGRVESQNVLATLPRRPRELRAADAGAAGMQVGPFELIEPLGRGGMGSVWRARYADGRLKRDVAVKLPAATGDATALAMLRERFDRERDFLAQLEHPNIARLYDAGVSDSGQPFLAMEYVAGRVINEHCDAEQLNVKARLRLFLQVLDAVAHAHQQLVLHRDLKAGNVLVDEHGQARLLDFGVARLLPRVDGGAAPSELTERAGAAFTLGHAAPEQLTHSALSTATDVYALGVMLYHLLTGLSPYQPARDTRGALEDAVLLATPEAASSRLFDPGALEARQTNAAGLCKELRGDLDVVLGKALKKNPAERYASAAALADDLHRHLAQQPIAARGDSWWYQTRLFVARNRVTVIGAGLASAALLVSTGTAVMQSRVSSQSAARAIKESARANAAQKFFVGLLSNADPEKNQQAGAADRQIADRALATAEREFADSPETLALVLKQLGEIYYRLGSRQSHLEVQKRRVALLAQLPGTPVDDVVESHMALGKALGKSERIDERAVAAARLIAAHELAMSLHASEPLVVQTLSEVADQYVAESKYENADRYAALALARAQASLRSPHPTLAWVYEQKGITASRLGHFDEARESFRKAMAIDSTGQGRGKVDQLNGQAHLANLDYLTGNYMASKNEALTAIAFARQNLGELDGTLTPMRIRAVLASERAGELDAAWALVTELLGTDLASADAVRSGRAYFVKGVVALSRNDFAVAAEAFGVAEPRLQADPRGLRSLMAQQAILALKTGQSNGVYERLEPVLNGIRRETGTSSEEFSKVATPAAIALARTQRLDRARSLFAEACEWPRATLNMKHPNRVRCESNIVLASSELTASQQRTALTSLLRDLTQGRDDRVALAAALSAAIRGLDRQSGSPTFAAIFSYLD